MTTFRAEINQLHAQVCSGLADPNRILILYTLAERPYNVSELAEVLDIPQPTVSRHLKILRERGMVFFKREGQAVYYFLADVRVIEALDLLRAMLANGLQNQGELAQSVREDKSLSQIKR
ncbi:MAG: winged helix-turn-helix transcriptional regulator [Chloroflexi bacterium]|nr:winged helix-turn-helix transcriptional regulator [Chloroflexota bacterium]